MKKILLILLVFFAFPAFAQKATPFRTGIKTDSITTNTNSREIGVKIQRNDTVWADIRRDTTLFYVGGTRVMRIDSNRTRFYRGVVIGGDATIQNGDDTTRVWTVFGRVGDIVALVGDYDAFYPLTTDTTVYLVTWTKFAADTTYKTAQLATKVNKADTTTSAGGSYVTPTQFAADTNFVKAQLALKQGILWTRAGGQLDPATTSDTVHVSHLGIGTVTGFNARLAVGGADSANVGVSLVRTDKNVNRSTLAQARDTSAVTFNTTASGKWQFTIRGPTGNLQFQVDSSGLAHGVFAAWDSAAYGGVYISDDHPDSIAYTYAGSVHTVGSVHAAAVQGYKWTSGGVLKNVTVGDSSMTVGVTGVYDVAWSMSIGSGAGVAPNAKFNAYIYVNNVKEEKTGSMRMLSGSNDIGQLVCTAMSVSLKANDIIKLKLINVDDANGNTVVVYYAKMHVTRIQ